MSEVSQDFSPLIRVYKDGHVERLMGVDIVPPVDPNSNVMSRDVVYSPELDLSCRLYFPKNTNPNQKLPLLVYFHGGGFVIETAFSSTYHNYLNTLVAEANVIGVSVDYRRAPEHPLPAAYDDSWTALKWVASHVNGDGPEEWLNSHADFSKVFFYGDSAGANISHQMATRHGQEKLVGVKVAGIVLAHPYFWGKDPIGNEPRESSQRAFAEGLWRLACPTSNGCDDPLINPLVDPNLARLECSKVLVAVAEKDLLRDRGWHYCEKLRENGWSGEVEIMEAKGENHVFHLQSPTGENARLMLEKISSFLNQDRA
uniref:Alpha/beta hydrolase fold-3 domain-containing protein n=1 Tax=Populus davidiana TaxID=266767 RepID=A0A6M2EFF7_9ROSI